MPYFSKEDIAKARKMDLLTFLKARDPENYFMCMGIPIALASMIVSRFQTGNGWAKHRHLHKGRWWFSTKYWHRKGNRNWVFCTEDKELIRVDHTTVVRHIKVRENANPFFDIEYFNEIKFKQGMKKLTGKFRRMWEKQNGCCCPRSL